jgi:hypothetical protein
LAPRDFFSFGSLKLSVKRFSFSSEQDVLLETYEGLRGISSAPLLAAFEGWMERFVCVAAHEAHSSPLSEKHKCLVFMIGLGLGEIVRKG